MRKRSIAWRMAAMFALTAAVVFTSVAAFLYCMLANSVREQIRAELQFHQTLLTPFIEARSTLDDWPAVQRKLNGMTPEVGRLRYWIDSPDPGFAYGRPGALDGRDARGEPLIDGFGFIKQGQPAKTWGVLITPVSAQGERPALTFGVALDATAYLQTKESFTRVMQIASALGIVLVALLGYWIVRRGLSPVRQLSAQANALPRNDPCQRLNVAGLPTEILELAVSFNNALERREAAWRQLEAFNADTAHELRTPLTNLIGQTQVALVHPRNAEELQDLLASNLEELERMSGIVNDMLFLSRADNGDLVEELTQVSLRVETQKTVEYLEDAFVQKSLTISIEGDSLVWVDRRLFHRAIANLLSNTVQYAQPCSDVRVSIQEQQSCIEVSVANRGDPIAPAQQTRLFERFYRGDVARTGSGVHHGLGLSIVRAIASMHGGDVFVHSAGGTNTFGFTLRRDLNTNRSG